MAGTKVARAAKGKKKNTSSKKLDTKSKKIHKGKVTTPKKSKQ